MKSLRVPIFWRYHSPPLLVDACFNYTVNQLFCCYQSLSGLSSEHTCQLSRFSRESPSFSSNLSVSRLSHQISRELPTVAFFQFFFPNFVICAISKKEIKQEVDLVLYLVLLFNVNQREQSNLLIFNEYSNRSEINRSYCIGKSSMIFGRLRKSSAIFGRILSRRLQIFVLWGLAGMSEGHLRGHLIKRNLSPLVTSVIIVLLFPRVA